MFDNLILFLIGFSFILNLFTFYFISKLSINFYDKEEEFFNERWNDCD